MSLISIINELIVNDVSKSLEFYENIFGFKTEFSEGEPITWAQLKNGDITLMLEDYNEFTKEIDNHHPKVNSSNLIMFAYNNTEEVQKLYEELKKKNVQLFKDYTKTDYGKVELGIYDPDNNMILISAPLDNGE